MGWVKVDDKLHANPKIRAAFRDNPGSLGLHLVALSYCGEQETDGFVDFLYVEERLPRRVSRDKIIAVLIDRGLWKLVAGGFQINDYLDYNESKAAADERRAAQRDRQNRHRSVTRDSGVTNAAVTDVSHVPSRTPARGGSGLVEVKTPFNDWLLTHAQAFDVPPLPVGTPEYDRALTTYDQRIADGFTPEHLTRAVLAAANSETWNSSRPAAILHPNAVRSLAAEGKKLEPPKPKAVPTCRECKKEINETERRGQAGRCNACYGKWADGFGEAA